jgi:hypothetical protein
MVMAMDEKRRECAAWVAEQIKHAELGRAELIADIARRKEALQDIRYSEPRYTAPENPKETVEFLPETERAAVAKFVADGNNADMAANRVRYSEPGRIDPDPPKALTRDNSMTEYERSVASAQSWETWLAARLEEERAHVFEMVGQAIGELLDEEAKAHETERNKLRDVEIALANTKADVTILRTLLLTNGKDYGVVDLPPWPKRETKAVN